MELRAVPHINDSIYDPLWATCQELAVPICFHAGASSAIQIPAYEGYSPTIAAAFQAITRPASTVSVLVNLLISKILMRFPKRSEEHTSELQSLRHLVCRLLLEKKQKLQPAPV